MGQESFLEANPSIILRKHVAFIILSVLTGTGGISPNQSRQRAGLKQCPVQAVPLFTVGSLLRPE